MKKSQFPEHVSIKNRRASYDYVWFDQYTAGMVLQGSEIKSIRVGKVSLQDCYCYFDRGELFVKGLHIEPYLYASHYGHAPDREKKLLLHKKELIKLEKKMKEKSLSIIPVRLTAQRKGYAKLEIVLAKGRKDYDKRNLIKEREEKKMLNRLQRNI